MKRRVISLAALLLLLVSMSVNMAMAATEAVHGRPDLTINGTTANCYVKLTGNSDDELSVTLTLWCGESIVDTWSDSGTGSVTIDEDCTVVRGNTYRLVMIYRINGVLQPQVSVSANS